MKIYIPFLILLSVFGVLGKRDLIAQTCGCVGCPAVIPISNSSFTLDYPVQGLVNDDLSSPGQCVASVNINFLHNRLQNLVIELISPSGQRIPLVGPYQAFGGSLGGTIGSSWNVDFVRCFPEDVAAPHPGTMEVWNNLDPFWNGFGAMFVGSYYPTGNRCLSELTGSANGTWQLYVENFEFPPPAGDGSLVDFSIEFCDETGLNCCGADAGEGFGAPPLDPCLEDRGLLFFENVIPDYLGTPPDPTQYAYRFLVFRDGELTAVLEDDIDLRDYPVGEYLIYGFSYLISDQAVVDDLLQNGATLDDIRVGSASICSDIMSDDGRFSITILPPSEERIEPGFICPNDSVFVAGAWRTMSDTIVEYLPSDDPSVSCAIQVTHILELLPMDTNTIQSIICEGESFNFDGQDLTTSGNYEATFTNETGCDSLVLLELTISDAIRTILPPQSICTGSSFDFNGQNLTEAGMYEANLTSESGCDSIVVLELIIESEIQTTLPTQIICTGSSFNFNGQILTETGTYQNLLTSENGCDSTVILGLIVENEIRDTLPTQTICPGSSFDFNGQLLTEGGTYEANLTSENGCDSTVVLELTVEDEIRTTLPPQSICTGASFDFDGRSLTEAGTYEAMLISENGCDSIVVLNLSIEDEIRTTLPTQAICPEDDFEFNGLTLTESGVYSDTLQTVAGCDSIIVQELILNQPSNRLRFDYSVCPGDSAFIVGEWRYTSDTIIEYRPPFDPDATCGVEVLHILEISSFRLDTTAAAICEGSNFSLYGQTFTDADIYRVVSGPEFGCDSVITTLNLEVIPSTITSSITETICQTDIYNFGDQILTTAGVYYDTLSAGEGCAITELTLTVSSDTTRLAQEICNGEVFDFNGRALTEAGIYVEMLSTVTNCDSIIVLDLAVVDEITTNLSATICNGATFDFNGRLLTTADRYRDTLQSASSCDSIVILELNVNPEIETFVTQTICANDSFDFNGQLLTTTGTYRDTLQSASSCDSIIVLELNINTEIETVLAQTICSNSSFDFNGQILTSAGTYRDTLQSVSSCDSIIVLNLTVDDQIATSLTRRICSGTNFDFNGQLLTLAGIYRDTFESVSGCDSIVLLDLEIEDISASIQANGTNLGCDLSQITLEATANVAIETIIWSDGISQLGGEQELTITEAGTYFLVVNSLTGCLDTTQITIRADSSAINQVDLTIQQPNCEGADIGGLRIGAIEGGIEPYVYALDDRPFSTNPSFNNLTIGTYTIRVQDAQGCEWDSLIVIDPPFDLTVTLGDDLVVTAGTEVTLSAFTNRNPIIIQWLVVGKDSLSCTDCLTPTVRATENAIYQIQVEDENGCTAQDQLEIFIEVKDGIYIPNIFSPNGDNINDYFYAQIVDPRVESIDFLQIYDRWGDLVFEQTNVEPNNPLSGWDGRTTNGFTVNTNVFIYSIKVNYVDGTSELLQGDVTRLGE